MMLGIDYASVDGDSPPDLVAAKAAHLRFAFVRADYATWQDPTAARDRDRIRAAGLVFGAYMFPVPSAKASPEEQVAAFVAGAQLKRSVDFAPVLDIEFPGGVTKTGKTRAELAEWIGRAVTSLHQVFGCRPIIYSSARVLDGTDADSLAGLASTHLVGCPLWLARYPYKTRIAAQIQPATVDALERPPVPASLGGDPNGWWIHQYEGDALQFPGFSSTVDCDRFNLLARGSKGSRVAWMKQRLGTIDSDGAEVFGDDTQITVEMFQRKHDLEPDGIVGPATFAALSWEP